MKALIVDDEKHVRDAIRLLVPWADKGVETILEAGDGERAIELIERERPELIFTDMMMPIVSGVELLRWMHEHGVPGKTIVISGHDDFALARQTIRFGGLDYILKPIEPEQLIQAVDRAIAELLREEEEQALTRSRAIELNRMKPVYWEKAFSQLLEEPDAYAGMADALEKERGLPVGTKRVRAAILSLEGLHPASLRSFSSDEELLYFAVTNICNDILGEEKLGYAFRYWNQRREIALLFWREPEQAEAVLGRIQQGFNRTLRVGFDFGISGLRAFPGDLPEAYREAKHALLRRNLLDARNRIHSLDQESEARAKPVHLAEYHESLRMTVYSGQPARIREAASDWVRAAAGSGRITPEQLEMWRGEYTVLLSQWRKEWFEGAPLPSSAGDAFALKLEPDGRFAVERWEQELAEELIRLAEQLHTSKQQANNVVYEIRNYIETHYQQEISLQDIASRFFLSREYISRKFKQELGENLSDYVGRIRIEKARQLLQNPQLKVVQIAQLVGYEDEKYFSKVFKKFTGLSPNEYRRGLWSE